MTTKVNHSDKAGTFTEHLEELRLRIIYSLLYLAGGAVAGFFLTSKYILPFMMRPLLEYPDATIQVLGITDKFAVYLNASLVAGLVMASPFILHQIWLFIRPGLLPGEQNLVGALIPISFFMFLLGAVFIYYVMIPASIGFLLGVNLGANIETAITLDRYFSFIINFVVAGGIIFQIPIISWALARAGILNPKILSGKRKAAILIATILGAVITPTGDPFNLALLTIPIYLLFELSILVAKIAYRIKREED